MNTSGPCPCGSGGQYAACCGRWHAGEPAPNADALMRSRYTAFVSMNERYLLDTWHSSTRPKSVPFDRDTKWLGLRVVESCETAPATAEVEFIARYRIGGRSAARLHERSRFVREHGRWYYVDGVLHESRPP